MNPLNLDTELLIIEVSGPDATTYLQGQLTNDILELKHKPYQPTAHLNNKGRILATFLAIQVGENHYYLITSKTIAGTIITRLKMFVLRSKVSIAQSTQHLSLQQNCGELSIELSPDFFLIINNSVTTLAEDSNLWHKILINLGLPMIYANTQEKIIPQQINYDLIGGVNFKKGCYTGQEIVARTHYLGKVKRRLAKFSCTTQPKIGQPVVSPLLDNQEVGIILDFYQDNDQLYQGLVSAQLDCLAELFLDNHEQILCTPIAPKTE